MTTLQGIIVVFLLVFFLVVIAILLRRVWRDRYFRELDLQRAKFNSDIKLFMEKGISLNLEKLKFPPKTLKWQALEDCLLDFRKRADDLNKRRITGLFEELSYTAFYEDVLKDGTRWQRALAAEKLGRIGSSSATMSLLEALKDSSRDVKSVSLRSLGLIRDIRTPPLIVKELPRILNRKDGVFNLLMKDALASFGEPIVSHILREIDGYDQGVLNIVIEILGEIGSKEAVPALINRLTNPDPEIRAKAAKALGKIRDSTAVPALLKMESEPIWFVRLHVCRALGKIGDPRGISFFTKALVDRNWQTRVVAAESLRKIGPPAFAVLSTTLMESNDRYAREQVGETMQRSGIVDDLIVSLNDSNDNIRISSKRLLSALASLGMTSIMREAAQTHSSELVRSEIGTILAGGARNS